MEVFWVHKDLSYSYKEGIDEKLKYKQKPYKMKIWKKCQMTAFWVNMDLSYSYREGIDKKLKAMVQLYKTKVLKKMVELYVDGI